MKIVPTPPTEEGYQLCLKFDDQSPAFARGFEIGTVFKHLTEYGSMGSPDHPVSLNADNVNFYHKLAEITRTVFIHEPSSVEGWVSARFEKKVFAPAIVKD